MMVLWSDLDWWGCMVLEMPFKIRTTQHPNNFRPFEIQAPLGIQAPAVFQCWPEHWTFKYLDLECMFENKKITNQTHFYI